LSPWSWSQQATRRRRCFTLPGPHRIEAEEGAGGLPTRNPLGQPERRVFPLFRRPDCSSSWGRDDLVSLGLQHPEPWERFLLGPQGISLIEAVARKHGKATRTNWGAPQGNGLFSASIQLGPLQFRPRPGGLDFLHQLGRFWRRPASALLSLTIRPARSGVHHIHWDGGGGWDTPCCELEHNHA